MNNMICCQSDNFALSSELVDFWNEKTKKKFLSEFVSIFCVIIIARENERRIMGKIIKLPEENLKGLHFFTSGMNFPVVAGSYSDWEKLQLSYLESNLISVGFNTESICQWCINHNIRYQILYPIRKSSILKNPYKYYKFMQLKKKLNYSL